MRPGAFAEARLSTASRHRCGPSPHWHATRLFARMPHLTLVRSARMKAVVLFAGLLLSGMAACACAQAADGSPLMGGERAKPAATGEDLLPAAPSVSDTASGTPAAHAAARAPAAARRAPRPRRSPCRHVPLAAMPRVMAPRVCPRRTVARPRSRCARGRC